MYHALSKHKGRDDGFTLVELLVVVIIIGILASIAIPVFLDQREAAWQSEIESDVRNAATAQETYFTQNGEYTTDTSDLTDLGLVESSGVGTVTVATADGSYCIEGNHPNLDGVTVIYDSGANGVNGDVNGGVAC